MLSSAPCKEIDSWLQEKYEFEPYWSVTLSNSENVWQDDDRDGSDPVSAWQRLQLYCQNDIYITQMCLHFRKKTIQVGLNCDGFFFVKSARGYLLSDTTHYFYLAGVIYKNQVHLKKYQCPDLVEVAEEIRSIEESSTCLIIKPNINLPQQAGIAPHNNT